MSPLTLQKVYPLSQTASAILGAYRCPVATSAAASLAACQQVCSVPSFPGHIPHAVSIFNPFLRYNLEDCERRFALSLLSSADPCLFRPTARFESATLYLQDEYLSRLPRGMFVGYKLGSSTEKLLFVYFFSALFNE